MINHNAEFNLISKTTSWKYIMPSYQFLNINHLLSLSKQRVKYSIKEKCCDFSNFSRFMISQYWSSRRTLNRIFSNWKNLDTCWIVNFKHSCTNIFTVKSFKNQLGVNKYNFNFSTNPLYFLYYATFWAFLPST